MKENKPQTEQFDSLQNELATMDDSRLPEILSGRLKAIADVNTEFEKAKEMKKKADDAMKGKLAVAQNLIDKADGVHRINPTTHRFFNHEYSTKADRIIELEKRLEDLGKYSSEAAVYQKQLALVQEAVLQSQTAVINVQEYQMKYLECTSEALKFLYGLSAYGIASTQAIVTNLELVLSGAKKKELGEMAKQQMFLVIDQLKSQENLQLRMEKNEDLLDDLQEELRLHAEKEEEYDDRFRKGEERDKKQDEQINKQIQKDAEHDKSIADGIEKDKEQDKKLLESENRDREQDRIISGIKVKDNEQDVFISRQNELNESYIKNINNLKKQVFILYAISVMASVLAIIGFFV